MDTLLDNLEAITKVLLSPENIQDLGLKKGIPAEKQLCFCLTPEIHSMMLERLGHLELILEQLLRIILATLLTSTPVDPRGYLLKSLQGAENVTVLYHIWETLTSQMRLACTQIWRIEVVTDIHEDNISSVYTTSTWQKLLEDAGNKVTASSTVHVWMNHP
jgi:hypothetical protein